MALASNDRIQKFQRAMALYVAAHVGMYAVIEFVFDLNVEFWVPIGLQLVMTAIIFIGVLLYNTNRSLSLDLSAISIVLTPAVLVYTLSGYAWQLDAHMYFFAALAMTIAFKSLRAALMATTAIALHHLVLNFVLPFAVFPDGADFARVVFHAVIVVVETAVILATIRGLQKSDREILAESEAAQKALKEANEAKRRQELSEARSKEERETAMNGIATEFDSQIGGLIHSLAASSTQLQSTAEVMRTIADKTAGDSDTVSQSSAEASQNVNTVASAMEEMSASAAEIASQVSNVRIKSNDTAQDAEQANITVGNLNQLAENIGEVVVSIRDIAEQTNLLALNATIEAARAGESGKGFAVVAEEVKKLATETADKTDEIESRINEIQNATKDSVDAMGRILGNIADIDGAVAGVSAAIEEQNSTTSEIVRSVTDASSGVEQVSQVIADVQKGAEETGLSSDSVLNAAREVAGLSDNLKNSVDQFLSKIRNSNSEEERELEQDNKPVAIAAE